MEKDWVKLATLNNLQKAEILRTLLESEGIETVVLNKKDSAYAVFGELEIYCHAENALKALEILEKNQPL